MNIALHGKNLSKKKLLILEKIIENIKHNDINVFTSNELKENLTKKNSILRKIKSYNPNKLKKCKYILSFGGDGTLLDTVTHIYNLSIPILGINIGKLGFLSTFDIKQIDKTIKMIKKNKLNIDKRSLITVNSNKKNIFSPYNFALNEFTVVKKDSSSMLTIKCFVNNELLNTYWADGLIIASPTGSTGYSLSCGGPIVSPDTESFIITPISPHNLSVRSLIVSNKSKIKLIIESNEYNFLTSLDSRSYTCKSGTEITIMNSKFKVSLAKVRDYSFFNTLRGKLNWGYDLRN
ncbi:MAG: NAD kinase [Flammeovirgaceae bacterium]|nr:NAD kinase [Flammeovirgaceae bacterium]|tara:strand:- start:792 stop:1667 length:876 start_codon:yes stop_codon:yes gene_type:complete